MVWTSDRRGLQCKHNERPLLRTWMDQHVNTNGDVKSTWERFFKHVFCCLMALSSWQRNWKMLWHDKRIQKECDGHCIPSMQQHLCSTNSFLACHIFSHLLPILQHVDNEVFTLHTKIWPWSEPIKTLLVFDVLISPNAFTSCSKKSRKLLKHSPFLKSPWCQLKRSILPIDASAWMGESPRCSNWWKVVYRNEVTVQVYTMFIHFHPIKLRSIWLINTGNFMATTNVSMITVYIALTLSYWLYSKVWRCWKSHVGLFFRGKVSARFQVIRWQSARGRTSVTCLLHQLCQYQLHVLQKGWWHVAFFGASKT